VSERPPALDVESVLEAAFAVRDTDPAYFGLWVADVYATESTWHDQPDSDVWNHHASTVGECIRKHVIARSGVEKEPFTVGSLVTFEVGKELHLLLQVGLAVHPEYLLLGHEIGGVAERDGIRLAALADAVYLDPAGQCCILDLKSEKDYARGWREKEAAAAARLTSVKPEHALQLKATAAVIHRLTEHRPLWGWVIYFNKNSGDIDPQLVPLGVADVVEALQRREQAWTEYNVLGVLPARLETFPSKGLCTPRSASDPRGKWCGFRQYCSGAKA
jgi:hypothetical protein